MMRRPRLPRTTGFLFAAALTDSCTAATITCLSFWLRDAWQAGQQATGLVLGLPTALYVVTTLVLGHAADRIGRRLACILALGLTALASFALPHAPGILWIGVLFGLQRVGTSMFWPALEGWLGHGASDQELPRRIAAFNIGWGTGWAAGTILGGLGYHYAGAATTLHVVGGIAVAAALLCGRLPASLPSRATSAAAGTPVPAHSADRMQAWAGMFAAYIGLGAVRALFPQYATTALHLDPGTASSMLAAVSIVQTATFVWLGIFRPDLCSGVWIRPSQMIGIAAMLLIAAPIVPIVALGLVLLGFHAGVVYAASFYRSVYGRHDASGQGGIHEAVVNAGAMLGPVQFGIMAEHVAAAGGWYVAAAAIATASTIGRRHPDRHA